MKQKREKRPTIYDIAEQLQIAPSSVSKALNNSPSVSEKVKNLVRSKAQELNYRHNSQAASLRRGKSRIVGVVVPKINSSFFSNAISGMEEMCALHQHQLIICQTEESYPREKQAVDTLITNNVDCIIISKSLETHDVAHLQEVIKHQIPLIQFDRISDEIESHRVVNDNATAAYSATEQLVRMGYKRIAFLGGSFAVQVYRHRKEGYLQAAQDAGLMVPYEFVSEGVITQEEAYRKALQLLDGQYPPDAFLTSSDYSAYGVIQAAASRGVLIPDQLGVIGFSNEPFSEMLVPRLTSVDQNSRAMGIAAAKIYFDLLAAGREGWETQLKEVPCEIVLRGTTRALF